MSRSSLESISSAAKLVNNSMVWNIYKLLGSLPEQAIGNVMKEDFCKYLINCGRKLLN